MISKPMQHIAERKRRAGVGRGRKEKTDMWVRRTEMSKKHERQRMVGLHQVIFNWEFNYIHSFKQWVLEISVLLWAQRAKALKWAWDGKHDLSSDLFFFAVTASQCKNFANLGVIVQFKGTFILIHSSYFIWCSKLEENKYVRPVKKIVRWSPTWQHPHDPWA